MIRPEEQRNISGVLESEEHAVTRLAAGLV